MANVPPRRAADLLVDCLDAEGCDCGLLRARRGDDGHPRRARRRTRIRHVTTRHEQGAAFMADVHGRLTGRAAVAMATLGPGATNLVTGIADAFLDRAPMVAITGQAGSDKLHKEAHQVVDIVADVRAGHQVEHARRAHRRHPRDRAQGVPGRAPGEARADPHRAAREPRRDRGRPVERRRPGPARARPDLLPRADRRGHRPRRRPHRRLGAADHPGRQRRPAPPRRAGAARPRPRPARPGRGDVHGQGRHRRPLAPVADGRRAPGPRPRAVRLRPGRPRHLRRLRPRRVRAGALEPGRDQADHPHRHPAGRGRRRLPARGRAGRRHRRHAAPAARGGPAPRHRRPRRRGAPRVAGDPRPRRPAHRAARATCRRTRADDGLADQAAEGDRATCGGRSPPTTSWSATSAPTRSGSPGCTRPTSPTRSSSRTASRRWASRSRAPSRPRWSIRIARSSRCAATAAS